MWIRRILVATDFSALSEPAVEHAVVLARRFGALIIVLHACEPIIPGDIYGAAEVTSLNAEVRRFAGRQLASLVKRLRKRGIRCRGVLAKGSPVDVILENARSVDLIVMGTHGRSGFSRLFIGSVAQKVVRGARCPVLTVRASEKSRKPAAQAASSGASVAKRRSRKAAKP